MTTKEKLIELLLKWDESNYPNYAFCDNEQSELADLIISKLPEVGKMVNEMDICPNCNIALTYRTINEARNGEYTFDIKVSFCEKCLYIGDSEVINISKS